MSQRAALTIQILEKIGAPLIGAVGMVSLRQGAQDQGADNQGSAKQDAERVAELLNKAVQVSINLSGTMDVRDSDTAGEAVRLALVALSGQLVASQYGMTGRVPSEHEIKKLLTGLEAVMTFSDNFAPAAEAEARLNALDGTKVPADENQISIQYVNAVVPVINAVAAFPFGRSEKKLVQDVVNRLVTRSQELCARLMDDEQKKEQNQAMVKQAELRILGALSALYVSCHIQQMNSLMMMNEKARNDLMQKAGGLMPMDEVWNAFETRAQMVEVLNSSILGGSMAQQLPSSAQSPATNPAPAAPPATASEEAPQGAQTETGGAASGNPMAMFAKKPAQTQDAPPPQAAPQAAPPASPPAEKTEPEAEPAAENPMAFFRGGDKKDDSETGN